MKRSILEILGTPIATFFLVSCALSPVKQPPVPSTKTVQNLFNKAEKFERSGQGPQAIATYKQIIEKHPNSDLADDAQIAIGQMQFAKRDFQAAYQTFMSVTNSQFFSSREPDALLGAAQSLTQLGRFDEALGLVSKGLRLEGLSRKSQVELYQLRFTLQNQMGDKLDALASMVFLAKSETSSPTTRESYRSRALSIVESQLNADQLSDVVGAEKYDFLRPYAAFYLGKYAFEEKNYGRAESLFEEVVKALPNTDLSSQAQVLIGQLQARRQVNPRTVGAILPLSGRHEFVGKKALQGIQLGLGIFGGQGRSPFRLAVIDSEGNADVARRGVERLILEDHPVVIIGSLLSKTSESTASKSDELGVPVIGLSQQEGLTKLGEYVFRNALTSEMIVRKLVKTAFALGQRKFAIIYPNDKYGVEYANLFWDEVLARGGQIVGAQAYDSQETDFSRQIQRLTGTFYVEARSQEYKLLLQDWYKKNPVLGKRQSPPDDLLPPIVRFDALFIPDNTKSAAQIAAMLTFNNVRGVSLLGTNLWNSPTLITRGEKHVEGAVFVDSPLSTGTEFTRTSFYKDFKAAFNEEPNLFSAQGYDAGLLVRQILSSGEASRVGVKQALENLSSFSGALGRLSMNRQRELEWPLQAYMLKGGRFVPIAEGEARP